jgi:hypothetical protein
VTITRVWCNVKAATSVVIQLNTRVEGTPDVSGTDNLTASLTCTTVGANTTSFASAAVTARAPVALTISAVTERQTLCASISKRPRIILSEEALSLSTLLDSSSWRYVRADFRNGQQWFRLGKSGECRSQRQRYATYSIPVDSTRTTALYISSLGFAIPASVDHYWHRSDL